jgi:hypothetical protein
MANPDRLGVAAAFAFVMVVYGISNSAGPDTRSNVSAVAQTR